jgi:hypothetical protein
VDLEHGVLGGRTHLLLDPAALEFECRFGLGESQELLERPISEQCHAITSSGS